MLYPAGCNNERAMDVCELLLDHNIDPGEYRQIKIKVKKKIKPGNSILTDFSTGKANIDSLLERSLAIMANLEELYLKADTKKKRQLVV